MNIEIFKENSKYRIRWWMNNGSVRELDAVFDSYSTAKAQVNEWKKTYPENEYNLTDLEAERVLQRNW